MERAERVGLGVATIGHLLLFGILSLGLVSRAKLPPLKNDPIDVVLVDAIGPRAAAPEATPEPPAPSEAPAIGTPEDVVAPAPSPAPSSPAPPPPAPPKPATKPEPRPVPRPEPKTVPKPEPKPVPKPVPRPVPKPATKPTPKPEPKPTPKPAPAKPAPAKSAPANPTPAKPAAAPAKATPAKASTAKPAFTNATNIPTRPTAAGPTASARPGTAQGSGDQRDRRRPDRDASGAGSAKTAKPAGGAPGDRPAKAAGSRLGPDFLKGIATEKTAPAKATKPAAAAVSATAMQGLAGAILRQVKPCVDFGSLGGTSAMSIVTSLKLQLSLDGAVVSATVDEQTGVTSENQKYARQMADLTIRAVRRCAPLKLPVELYEGGWKEIYPRFLPSQLE